MAAPAGPSYKDGLLDQAAEALSRSKEPGLLPAERDAAEDTAACLLTAANNTPAGPPAR